MDFANITAISSIVISVFTLINLYRTENRLKSEFEKTRSRGSTDKLIALRLEKYPDAFEITDKIQKRTGNQFNKSEIELVKNELYLWKTGITRLIISNKAYGTLLELLDSLAKNTAHGEKYSQEQVNKIWNLRNEFRRGLRKDIGILHTEDENSN